MSYSNFVQLKLSTALTAGATSMVVTSPVAPFVVPQANGFLTLLDIPGQPTKAEIVGYTTVTNNGNGTHTLGGLTRGQEGTTAQSFAIGATVIEGLTAAQYAADLAAREASIAAGTTAQYWCGDKSWRDLATDIRAAVLTGLSLATSTVVAATDTVLVAIGKLQAQITLRAPIASPTFTGTVTGPTIVASGTTASTSTTTGSLRTSGGLGVAGAIFAGGNIAANSDARLKTDIELISDALEKICAIRGVTYTRIDSGERQAGVIAQEVQAVLPEVVSGDEILGVAYGNLVGLLIEAIKELKAEVDALKGGK